MKVLVSCFSGSQNVGDELILRGLKEQLNNHLDNPDISVLTLDPKEVSKWHPDIQPVHRPDPGPQVNLSSIKNIPEVYRETDLVVIGGGGLIQDTHTPITIPRYLQSVILGKIFNCKVVMIGVGVGPIKRPISKMMVKNVLKLCDYISVRDQESRDVLQEVGVKQAVDVAADLAYGLQLNQYNEIDNEDSGITGLVVREFNFSDKSFSAIGDFCSDITAGDHRIMFIPFGEDGSPPDVEVGDRIGRYVIHKKSYNVCRFPDNINTQIERVTECEQFIAGRLHAVILSSILRIPVVGLAYLPKVKSELLSLGYEENDIIEDTSDISPAELKSTFENVRNNPELNEKIRDRVLNKTEAVQESVQKGIEANNEMYELQVHAKYSILFTVCYFILFIIYIWSHIRRKLTR